MSRDKTSRNQYKTYWCRNLQRPQSGPEAKRPISRTATRSLAAFSIAAIAIAGAKVASDNTMPGSGFSTIATVAADPTGPTGGPGGGPGGMNGSQFQPPQMPSSMPDYQGGINQPPLDQNSGISIYNTGSPGAQQVPGQQAGQQPQQAQQPAHGTQIPDYQTNPGYTQGPGKPNPDYQAPQQQSPQQGQQPQQQPSQAPTQTQQPEQPQNKQDDTTRQMDQRQQKCQAALTKLGYTAAATAPSVIGGGGRTPIWFDPRLDPIPAPDPGGCTSGCDEPQTSQSDSQRLDDIEKRLQENEKRTEDLQKDNDKIKDDNRKLNCQATKDFSKCPDLRRKPVKPKDQQCEGTISNPTPLCKLNPYDTKYCTAGEVLSKQYDIAKAVLGTVGSIFSGPGAFKDVSKAVDEFTKQCQQGAP
ncbi:Uncharacterised protein [Mycobacteroides abscessus subsp. abscessus]|nr:Uncharacterised protein [Mycobacteroides abscessus subsp. abscessus]